MVYSLWSVVSLTGSFSSFKMLNSPCIHAIWVHWMVVLIRSYTLYNLVYSRYSLLRPRRSSSLLRLNIVLRGARWVKSCDIFKCPWGTQRTRAMQQSEFYCVKAAGHCPGVILEWHEDQVPESETEDSESDCMVSSMCQALCQGCAELKFCWQITSA